MNEHIELLMNHRSVRKFEAKPLTKEQIEAIVTCAQAASTSSFIQAYTIIGITDPEKKKKLAEVAGEQSYVANNGHFFIFCADLARHERIGEMENKDVLPSIESTEKFMVALIDTALAAQNAAIAAESMGLGICYIGGLRNNLKEVCKLLKTPKRVLPLFGMAVGFPAQMTDKKPRLPLQEIYHENEYQQNMEEDREQLNIYNQIISEYYSDRTNGARNDTWTGQMANMLERKTRMYMKEFVESVGMKLN
ncbi:oxygen-insensitive NADPH nitroreductase [Cytobacillus depressus]|uniref:Oxygen-insensitive NADPH nitroreductase n=1 Tax=Cytobacillus depressus TaxID=1602942 RepID=A0A6L3V827_9BACI|nr:oxygen-insensitive NADPH nitroreductase [Cytobacillus depressus]KAB2337068.1 oxygen-insensitive NADPH nitroreductase [Cytobacillus depressus]